METRCVRVRLKADTIDAVRDWQAFMHERHDEVVRTLASEGVVLEAVFLDSMHQPPSLIYVMRCADFDRAADVARTSNAPVDIYHRTFKKTCWDTVEELEILLDISLGENLQKRGTPP